MILQKTFGLTDSCMYIRVDAHYQMALDEIRNLKVEIDQLRRELHTTHSFMHTQQHQQQKMGRKRYVWRFHAYPESHAYPHDVARQTLRHFLPTQTPSSVPLFCSFLSSQCLRLRILVDSRKPQSGDALRWAHVQRRLLRLSQIQRRRIFLPSYPSYESHRVNGSPGQLLPTADPKSSFNICPAF
jgi:hypothetical protein